jgi:predicted AAA+ superfamily ATPase
MVPRTGNLLDITKIASELGTNRMKVYDYLEFLQGVFFLKLIPKFSKSIDRSVAGGKKIYFSDTGILNTIGKVNEGQLFENAVANQLSVYGDLSFYNQRNTAEIDFIVEKHTCFEAKLTATSQAIQRLNIQSGKIGIGKSYVVSKNYVGLEGVIYPMFL